ncbi:retrovirus-related pol polyprotein from transposon TNT 1-94 [Tanacetum coccineum]|uniref:Retrovirus-related pol polyprotein from transposon TNT 1-94 n=1 Tax=Tanacetum coccineum TaxID=301880 RepID=A0ABQ4Z173_9ASTR
METIHVTFDELTIMASEHFSLGPGLLSMTPTTSSLGLVPNPVSQQPCIPLSRNDWDRLFQPKFDEYFNPPQSAVSPVPVATAPRAVDIADSPVSTSIDQDAPSTNADHAGCQDTRRSTSGSAQFLGEKLVSWSSKKQKSTVISSREAEYIALSGCLSGEWNSGTILYLDRISTGRHLLASSPNLFQEKDSTSRKAWYVKHVSGNAKTSGRGRG